MVLSIIRSLAIGASRIKSVARGGKFGPTSAGNKTLERIGYSAGNSTNIGKIAAQGAVLGASFATGSDVVNTAFETVSDLIMPNTQVNSLNSNGGSVPDYLSGNNYLPVIQMYSPVEKDLKSIDDFFESYGYNISEFKEPKLDVRDNFTYVKTGNAQVTGSNYNANMQMSMMLNSGCKFWKTDIGN